MDYEKYKYGWHNGQRRFPVELRMAVTSRIEKMRTPSGYEVGVTNVLSALEYAMTIHPTSNPARLYLRHMVPYCIQNVEGVAVPLNREYRPIGVAGKSWGGVWVPYEAFTTSHGIGTGISEIYFFNDGNPPWSSGKARDQLISRIIGWLDDNGLTNGVQNND